MPAKLKSKLKQTEFYCVQGPRRRIKVDPEDIYLNEDRNGRVRLMGKSPNCPWNLYKYVKEKDVKKLEKKYDWK